MKNLFRFGFLVIVAWLVVTAFLTPKMSERQQAKDKRQPGHTHRKQKVRAKHHKKAIFTILETTHGGMFQNVLLLGHQLKKHTVKTTDKVLLLPKSIKVTSQQHEQLKEAGWSHHSTVELPAQPEMKIFSIVDQTHYKNVAYISPDCLVIGDVGGVFSSDSEQINVVTNRNGVSIFSMIPSEDAFEELLSLSSDSLADGAFVQQILLKYAKNSKNDLTIKNLDTDRFGTVINTHNLDHKLAKNTAVVRFEPDAFPWTVPSRSIGPAYYSWERALMRMYVELWPSIRNVEVEFGKIDLKPTNSTYADLVLRIATVPGSDCLSVCTDNQLECSDDLFSLLLMREHSTLLSAFGTCPHTCAVSPTALTGVMTDGSCSLSLCESSETCPTCGASNSNIYRLCPCRPLGSTEALITWNGSLHFNHFPDLDAKKWFSDPTY